MFAFTIDKSALKEFMGMLIKSDVFDFFEVRSVEIQALAHFEITTRLDRDFLTEDGDAERLFCTWKEIRPHVFNIIKGAKRPKSMKIVLSLPSADVALMHQNAAAYFLNIYFENDEAHFTAAASEKVFSMDRTIVVKWEEYIKDFMARTGIVINY